MPELPSTAKGAATSRRILDAAAAEFALHGIAGARIERVVQAAKTNKAQLYAYYGNKDGLFDAVIADLVVSIMNAAPFDATDLAGWAVRLYDVNLHRSDLLRLGAWTRLERRPLGPLFEDDADPAKIAAIEAAQRAGLVRPGKPYDLLAMVIAMACTWSPVSTVYAGSADEPEADHERRRTLLHECVSRALAP